MRGRSKSSFLTLRNAIFFCFRKFCKFSFCPDPCCGRSSNRTSPENYFETFCLNSICLNKPLKKTKNVAKAVQNYSNPPTENQQLIKPGIEHSCFLDPRFNNDMPAIVSNNWNLSCGCVNEDKDGNFTYDNTRIYRFDAQQCVDINECLYTICEKG